jgi:DNA-binding SARP family transcriptional activator
LVHHPAPVPERQLLEALWPNRPPESALASLRVALSQARAALDVAERSIIVVARDRTHRLDLNAADTVDAEIFERAAATALSDHGTRRRELLEQALAGWGGDPLPEDRYATWAAAWRARLLEHYEQVLAELATARAAAGDHFGAIRVAAALVELDPTSERGHRELMTAQARLGRIDRALSQYLACRRIMVEYLAIEPSFETMALHQRILRREPV